MDIKKELKDEKYTKEYTESKLLAKIMKFAKSAGIKVIYLVLLLYYTLQQASTPKLAKSMIMGGLGYFILPIDLVPDIIPMVGFTDDLTALVSVLLAVALFINDDTKIKAKEKLSTWFGNYDETELEVIDDKIKSN
jgi:uncharacterized membrane protein YkvA (DUF1232 family)